MKTSAVLTSLFFASFAVAAPFDKRALVYKTETVVETVVVYTTVYDDEPAATPTSSAGGEFYAQPITSSAVAVASSSAARAYSPPVEQPTSVYAPAQPSSAYTPPVQTSTVQPPVSTIAPVASSAAPLSSTTQPGYSVPPVASSAAPLPSSTSGPGGQQFTGVDMTIDLQNGANGACGKPMDPTKLYAALAAPTWGESTYDVMTGEATNPWCGQEIEITHGDKTTRATIMDLCPGCAGADLDVMRATWNALGETELKRVTGVSWKKI